VSERDCTRRPRILVVGCGGSISSVSAGLGAVPTLDAAQLVAELPEVEELAEIEARSFGLIPSAYMTLDLVAALHDELRSALGSGWYDGAVVTHGTDTLEEAAFALDLLWSGDAPIIVTGAMRNASLPSPDGPANILASIATAAAPAARGLGALVVLNDEIHAARLVQKSHTTSLAAFRSPSAGPIGYVAEGEARIVLVPARREALRPGSTPPSECPVALLTLGIGDDGRLLDAVLRSGYAGLVLEAFGGGHIPAKIAESDLFAEALAAMPVVLSSRTGAGPVLQRTYAGWSGSELDLLDRGLVSSGQLDGLKARVLLTLLLAGGADRREIARAFAVHGGYQRRVS